MTFLQILGLFKERVLSTDVDKIAGSYCKDILALLCNFFSLEVLPSKLISAIL